MSELTSAPERIGDDRQGPEDRVLDEGEIPAKAVRPRGSVAGPALGGILSPLVNWISRLGEALARARLAHELAGLDDRTLADIGLKRSDIPSLFMRDRALPSESRSDQRTAA